MRARRGEGCHVHEHSMNSAENMPIIYLDKLNFLNNINCAESALNHKYRKAACDTLYSDVGHVAEEESGHLHVDDDTEEVVHDLDEGAGGEGRVDVYLLECEGYDSA